MKRKSGTTLLEYVFRFAEALAEQIEKDIETDGDDWRKLPVESQEDLIYQQFEQFWVEFSRDQNPIPWLKITELAMIAWVRDHYPKTILKP